MEDSPKILFGKPFAIGTSYPNLTSLDAIRDFAHEAYQLIGNSPWTSATNNDLEKTRNDLRAGFMGTVLISSAHLGLDGEIPGATDKSFIEIDGIRIDLAMTLLPTGVPEIPMNAAVVIGNGARRFEVRAYDLREQRFGVISCAALKQYLQSSRLRGGGTGTKRINASGLVSRQTRNQANK